MDVTTSSTSYPSQYTFPKRNDFCLVIRKIDKICQVGSCLSQQHNIFYLLQDNFKRIVFERHYRGRFSCATFPADIRRKCQENPRTVINSPPAEEAATEYARENLALIKIFIRLGLLGRENSDVRIMMIRDPFYTKIKIDQRVTWVSFFGNVGGFLGLLTGLSVMSLVEIFYHLGLLCKRLLNRK